MIKRQYLFLPKMTTKHLFCAPVFTLLACQAHALECGYDVTNDWGSGFTAGITVTNDGTSAVNNWQVQWQQNGGSAVTGLWNATFSGTNPYTAADAGWNATIAPGSSVAFGFQGEGDDPTAIILSCTADGATSSSSSSSASSSSSSSSSSSTSSSASSSASSSGSSNTSTAVIQEGEGLCSVEGTIDSNNAGYTGSGFANTENAAGKGIEWSVAAQGGSYQMQWRYANGSSANRPGDVFVNGALQTSSAFGSTGDWTTWADSSAVSINLAAGINTIRLQASSSEGLANIDSLSVTGASPDSAACNNSSSSSSSSSSSGGPLSTLTVQENTAGFCGVDGSVNSNEAGFTSGGFANTTNAVNTSVDWAVDAATAGYYDLALRFANGSGAARPGVLTLTSGASVSYDITFATTGAWSTWATEIMPIFLNAGKNLITLTATGDSGLANIDYLSLTGSGGLRGVVCPAASATVWLAGDSIVQTYTDTSSTRDQAGWGQMLREQYNTNVTVNNLAIGGRTARRFIEEGRLDTIWSNASTGDYLLLQFGTNDSHRTATYVIDGVTIPYYLDPQTDFKDYLKLYIDGARNRGIHVGLVTPTPRNSAYCTGGNGTGAWAQAMRELADEEGVPLIDLNLKTVNYLTAICPAPIPENFFFLRADGSVDGTHFQENGARILSGFVADGIGEAVLGLDYFRN
ncbi:cellulose binding domain-containing protein [Teredinibacter turnerae]|uniref:cellulose binding domain-containing protein n=1 Tax=Teredinibacter turnerae TaxID=2426 RepID=UPI0030D5FAB6